MVRDDLLLHNDLVDNSEPVEDDESIYDDPVDGADSAEQIDEPVNDTESVDDDPVDNHDEPFLANCLNETCNNCGSILDQDYLCQYLCNLSDDEAYDLSDDEES